MNRHIGLFPKVITHATDIFREVNVLCMDTGLTHFVDLPVMIEIKTLRAGADPGEVKWVKFHPPFF